MSAGFSAIWEMWTKRAVGGSVVGSGDRCVVKGEVAEDFMKLGFMMGELGDDIVDKGEGGRLGQPMLLRCVADVGKCELLPVLWYERLAVIAPVADVLISLHSRSWSW